MILQELANQGKVTEAELRAMVAQAGLEFCAAHESRIRALVGAVRRQREQSSAA
jgi:hypothetical protein